MYFCILHSKMYEMLALREVATEIVSSGQVMPVIEPVAADRNLELALDAFIDATMQFCLVVNPEVGAIATMAIADMKGLIFDVYLSEYDNVLPTFNVSRNTTTDDVADFCTNFAKRRVFYFLAEPPRPVVDAIAAALPEYVLFLRGSVSTATKARFEGSISVDVAEAFCAAPTNADYLDDEFFSEATVVLPNDEFSHFGDYTITGRPLGTGWAPYCVAVHYIYINAAQDDRLFIKHFISDTNDTQDDPAGKYAEALAKLVAAVPILGHRNRTATTEQFEGDSSTNHYPGLPTLKKRGVTHHIRLLISAL